MNDDFLRRARRPPPPAFANQLRERLRQLDLAEPPRRRPSLRLLVIPLLIGGTVLAAATYMTIKHVPLLSAPPAQVAQTPTAVAPQRRSNAGQDFAYRANPANIAPDAEVLADAPSTALGQPQSKTSGTRDDGGSSANSANSGLAGLGGTHSSTRSGAYTGPPPVRLVVSHDVAAIMDKASPAASSLSDDVEVTNADAAFQALCAKAPMHRPDVVFASRAMSEEEVLRCSEHGAVPLETAKVGHMAIVITAANDGNTLRHPMRLSRDVLLLALLKKIPSPDDPSRLIDNPYTHWNQIDRSLDDRRIRVLGPMRDSLQFLVFAATILEPACDKYPEIRALQNTDRRAYEEICHTLREADGVYTPAPLDNTFIRQRLWSDPGAIAVMDYRFYSANSADLLASLLAGVTPTRESILDGSYVGARTIHLYVTTRARFDPARGVKFFLERYLRSNDFAHDDVLISPDGQAHWRQARPAGLTEVRLNATQRKQP